MKQKIIKLKDIENKISISINILLDISLITIILLSLVKYDIDKTWISLIISTTVDIVMVQIIYYFFDRKFQDKINKKLDKLNKNLIGDKKIDKEGESITL